MNKVDSAMQIQKTEFVKNNPPVKSSKKGIYIVFFSLMCAVLMSSLDGTIFATAMPAIVGELNGVHHMAWISAAYLLCATVTMPLYGKISDLIGRKHIYIFSIFVFLIGSVVGALAFSMEMFIIGRGIQGIGGGGLMLLSQAIIGDVVAPRERAKYMGIMGAIFAFSSVVGPLIGGWLADGPGWRWAFWINIPMGLFAIFMAIYYLKLPKYSFDIRKFDVWGMVFIFLSTICVILALTWGGIQYPWFSVEILGLLAVGFVSIVLFVFAESRASEAIFPLFLFKNKDFNIVNISIVLFNMTTFGVMVYLPTYFQMALGVSSTNAGLLMVPMVSMLLVSSIVAGRIVSKFGTYKVLLVCSFVVEAFGLFLISTFDSSVSVLFICVALGVFGLGIGVVLPVFGVIVQGIFSSRVLGSVTGVYVYFRYIGSALGASVIGTLFASRLQEILFGEVSQLKEIVSGKIQMAVDSNLQPGVSDISLLREVNDFLANGVNSVSPEVVHGFSDSLKNVVADSYTDALMPVLFWTIPIVVLIFSFVLFLGKVQLKDEAPLVLDDKGNVIAENHS